VSIAVAGAAFGSIIGGYGSDRIGRKRTILAADVLFIIGSLLMGIAQTILHIILGRFIVGLGIGVAAMAVPVYLAEISPTKMRGTIVAINTLFITIG
jgi:SP family myo-inositol transporter-like MFS transporter 13